LFSGSSSSTSSLLLHCLLRRDLLFCSLQPSSTACDEHLSENRCPTARQSSARSVSIAVGIIGFLPVLLNLDYVDWKFVHILNVPLHCSLRHVEHACCFKTGHFLIPHSRYCCTHGMLDSRCFHDDFCKCVLG
jgi:hypothetical protein